MQCFFLCPHVNLSNIFEAIARYILGRIFNCEGDTSHFVCDKWNEPWIKEREEKKFVKSNIFRQSSNTDKTIILGEALTLIRLGFLRLVFSEGGEGGGGVLSIWPPTSYFKKNWSNINITLYNS